jgi:hypothetical protein
MYIYVVVVPEVLCSDTRALSAMFDVVNEGLVAFINSDPKRPHSQPEFLPFTETVKCFEDELPQVVV